jgi:glucose-6-phosphate isomerase
MDLISELQLMHDRLGEQGWLSDDLSPDQCLVSACGIDLFFGRNKLGKALLRDLLLLPEKYNLSACLQTLFSGQSISGHASSRKRYLLSSPEWSPFRHWAHALRQGRLPDCDRTVKDVIHLGAGGSRLGPELVIDALGPNNVPPFQPHFVSSQDPRELQRTLASCDPETTLILIVSKSFRTIETLSNAAAARVWLQQRLPEQQVTERLLAITSEPEQAQSWGCSRQLTIDASTCGRFSISSPVSLIAAAYLEESTFTAFMAGLFEMDRHAATAGWHKNLPSLLALFGVYVRQCLSVPTRCVIPYTPKLNLLIPYLQQLFMESLGKPHADHATGALLWGGIGCDSQHSFHQLIMQGSDKHHIDFIAPKDCSASWRNALAQAQLMQHGNQQTGEKAIGGGHSSNSLFISSLNPRTLGALVSLYEHQCFIQSLAWDINCFNQPGVEAGKQLASALLHHDEDQLDSSNEFLQKLYSPRIPTG